MNPKPALSIFLILLALATGGCRTQLSIPQAVDVEFTLETAMRDGMMIFVGVGGEIDGTINPDLITTAGDTIRVTLVNGDGIRHDFSIRSECTLRVGLDRSTGHRDRFSGR